MSAVLPTIHMLWHGAPLSRVERLAMASFVANGHPVDLYSYCPLEGVPAGVNLRDAEPILSQALLFAHRRTGSFGTFADWFRYRLLHEKGGIWADTDVVCLRPFDYGDPHVFGWENGTWLNTAVLGLPAGSELAAWMARCCEDPNRVLPYDDFATRLRKWRRRFLQGNRRERIRWGEYGPKGITSAARHLGLIDRALPATHFYPVPYDRWRWNFEAQADTAEPTALYPPESRAVHLWHAMLHTAPGFDKNGSFPVASPFERLWARYLESAPVRTFA